MPAPTHPCPAGHPHEHYQGVSYTCLVDPSKATPARLVDMRLTLGEGPAKRIFRKMRFINPDGTFVDVEGVITVDGLTYDQADGEFAYAISTRLGLSD